MHIRTLMIAVLAASIAFCLVERRSRFEQLAEHYRGLLQPVEDNNFSIKSLEEAAGIYQCTEADVARPEWPVAMQRKYERAARYPWLPVWPDLPEPR